MNRFLADDIYGKKGMGRRSNRPGSRAATLSRPEYVSGSLAAWSRQASATDRALVILIENGGVDLGIPDLVDKLLDAVPGADMIPDSWRQKLIDHIRDKIKSFTDSLLETLELSVNRYSAAKPEFFGEVAFLRDSTATRQDLENKLFTLSQSGKIVDVIILTHGSNNYISVTGGVDDTKIRAMKAKNGKSLSIRSVYMMNCVGSSLNKAWIDAGAKTSCGAVRNNYLPEPTTFFFWRMWKQGKSFEQAATSAYRQTIGLMNTVVRSFINNIPIPGTSLIANAVDFAAFDFVKDSAPVIEGDGSVTINSDNLTFAQSVSTGMAVTVLPVRMLEAIAESGTPPARAKVAEVSQSALDLIKQHETFRPKLYSDSGGFCSIGYGTPLHEGKCDGREAEQKYTGGITEEAASQLLADKARGALEAIADTVKVALNQNQKDALVSFVFNIGVPAFQKSTLLRLLNEGNYAAVPAEMKKWIKARQNGQVSDVPALVKRREAEAALFQKAEPPQSPAPVIAQSIASRRLPLRHSFSYHSSSNIVAAHPRYALAQNPAAAVVGGIAIADAASIGLSAIAIVQAQVSASQGSFTLSYDKAQRLLTTEARAQMPGSQTSKKSYSHRIFFLSIGRAGTAEADVIIEWEGNPYGEISTPVIRRNLSTSTEWSKSSANITITKVDRIPLPNTDPRTWPIVYTYEGTYDPIANGYFEFSGEFEVNAFGGLKFNRHEVVSRSLLDATLMGTPEDKVHRGTDQIVAVPALPEEQIKYLKTKLP